MFDPILGEEGKPESGMKDALMAGLICIKAYHEYSTE
jgi:hypothetical protein